MKKIYFYPPYIFIGYSQKYGQQIIIKDMYGSEYQQEQGHHHDAVDSLTKLNASLSLAKAMPPSKLKKNLIGLVNLAPQIQDNLLEKIQLPLEIDNSNPNFPFLKTEFNRDGNNFRNPYSNYYSPQHSDGYKPTGIYRSLQQNGSVLFGEYIKQYYGNNTVGNFYVTEGQQGNGNLSCGFFAKKVCDQGDGFDGSWDSFNIVDITYDGTYHHYNLNTTVLIQMDIENNGINLTGYLKKNKTQKKDYKGKNQSELFDNHLVTIGQMIEDLETVMRQHLEAIYVAKTKQIIFTTRYENTIGMEKHRLNLANDLRKLRFGE